VDKSERFKREMIRILKVKLKGNEGYDISPIILASALANLSSTESAIGGDQHRAMPRVDSTRERHSARPWP